MPIGERKYSDAQRDALETAHARRIRPLRRICELARAGELETSAGETVGPFEIPEGSARAIIRRARRRADTGGRRALAALPPADGLELVRRRLLGAIDHELGRVERAQQRGREIPGEKLRQIARAARELAALPGPAGEPPAAPRPGSSAAGDGATRGGLAASIIRAHEPRALEPSSPDLEPVHEPAGEKPRAPAENTGAGAAGELEPARINAADDREPGAYAAAQIARLARSSSAAAPAERIPSHPAR